MTFMTPHGKIVFFLHKDKGWVMMFINQKEYLAEDEGVSFCDMVEILGHFGVDLTVGQAMEIAMSA